MKLYLDIETIPLAEKDLWALKESYQDVQPEVSFDEYVHQTALSADWGRIFCIGYALDDSRAQVLCEKEEDMLVKFWDLAKDADRFIGHYILGFDLPFIYRRSAALKIEPPVWLTAAKRDVMVHDTKLLWKWWNKGIKVSSSLEHLAKHFGLPSPKTRMSGQDVYDYYRTGRLDEILDYCKKDVETTREIYKRLSIVALRQ
jgi:predicted PolB exonuclease-like 3'-5' exonuclease